MYFFNFELFSTTPQFHQFNFPRKTLRLYFHYPYPIFQISKQVIKTWGFFSSRTNFSGAKDGTNSFQTTWQEANYIFFILTNNIIKWNFKKNLKSKQCVLFYILNNIKHIYSRKGDNRETRTRREHSWPSYLLQAIPFFSFLSQGPTTPFFFCFSHKENKVVQVVKNPENCTTATIWERQLFPNFFFLLSFFKKKKRRGERKKWKHFSFKYLQNADGGLFHEQNFIFSFHSFSLKNYC